MDTSMKIKPKRWSCSIKTLCVQVRLSTAVWLWALQLVGLLLVGVGQKVEGPGGSLPAMMQVCLFCSSICLLALGLAVEVGTIHSGRSKDGWKCCAYFLNPES